MEEKLTLEQIAPYLPYNPFIWHLGTKTKSKLTIIYFNSDSYCNVRELLNEKSEWYKLILRPLNDYNKIDAILDEFSENTLRDFKKGLESGKIILPYEIAVLFFKNHIDLFNLIPQGLAVNMHELN